jgi:hypothetical protein
MRLFRIASISASLLLLSSVVARAESLKIPIGSQISVRMIDALDSKRSQSGEAFRATVDAPVVVNGVIVIPKGADAIGRITESESSGRLRGRATLIVELTAVNFEGKSLGIHTTTVQEMSASRAHQSMKVTGGATAAGTVLGLMGGAPWIGSSIGAAAGAAYQAIRGRSQIRIPAESLLSFTLVAPISLE